MDEKIQYYLVFLKNCDIQHSQNFPTNFPILEIDIHRARSGKEGQLHNIVRIFLLENVEINETNGTVTPIYSNTGFRALSGAKFSTAAEVGTIRKGYKG